MRDAGWRSIVEHRPALEVAADVGMKPDPVPQARGIPDATDKPVAPPETSATPGGARRGIPPVFPLPAVLGRWMMGWPPARWNGPRSGLARETPAMSEPPRPPPPETGNAAHASGQDNVAVGRDVRDSIIAPGAHLHLEPVRPEKRLHQLPAALPRNQFVGRQHERKQLREQLRQAGERRVALSALKGMGGVGKTALAVYVAHEVKKHFPDAQLFLDLRGTTQPASPAEAMAHVIRSFHPETAQLPEHPAELLALYRSVLAGRRVLLVLDNAAGEAQVRDLLPPPPCGLILTARVDLALDGVLRVQLDMLRPDEARALLRGIVGPARATDAELDAIARLCGWLPLGLRVAGDFLRLKTDFTAAEYRSRLEQDRLQRLKVGTDPAKDVAAVLAFGAAQLVRDDPGRAARWQGLSVFPADFDVAAAAAVWGLDPADPAAQDELSALVERSLVQFGEAHRRYALHELLRPIAAAVFTYGGAAPAAAEAAAGLHEAAYRFAAHYRDVLAAANELYLRGEPLAGLALFDREDTNIRHGQAWAARHPVADAQVAALRRDYPDAGVFVLDLRLHGRERLVWLESALEACRRLGDRGGEGNALGNLGNAHLALGDARQAIAFHQQALGIACALGDRGGAGQALGNLGNAHLALGDARQAIAFYEQWLEIARALGTRRGEGTALGNLGLAHYALGDARQAIAFHEQTLEIARALGDRVWEGTALGNLGLAHYALGHLRQAIAFHEQALEIARALGNRGGAGHALGNLGVAHAALGDARQAIAFYEQWLEIARAIGDRRGEGNALGCLGTANHDLGDARQAIAFYEQHLEIARAIGDRRGEGNALWNSAVAYNASGDRTAATRLGGQALDLLAAVEDPIADKVRQQLAAWRSSQGA
jgi:tetratricopeptide (TPR) repeat protein